MWGIEATQVVRAGGSDCVPPITYSPKTFGAPTIHRYDQNVHMFVTLWS